MNRDPLVRLMEAPLDARCESRNEIMANEPESISCARLSLFSVSCLSHTPTVDALRRFTTCRLVGPKSKDGQGGKERGEMHQKARLKGRLSRGMCGACWSCAAVIICRGCEAEKRQLPENSVKVLLELHMQDPALCLTASHFHAYAPAFQSK